MLTNRQINNFASIEDLIYIVIVSLYIFVFPQLLTKAAELGCLVSAGQFMFDKYAFLSKDFYTFTSVNSLWVDSNWLSGIIYAFAHNLGGFNLIVIISSLIIGFSFVSVFRLMSQQYNNWFINIILLTLGIIASSECVEANSRLFSLPIFILFIFLLDKVHNEGTNKKFYGFIILLCILWANFNTDFLLGSIAALTYMASLILKYRKNKEPELLLKARTFFIISLIPIAASIATPYGINTLIMIESYFISGLYVYNGFLASPDFHIKIPFGFFELFILLLIFLSLFSNYKPPLEKLLLSVVFLFLSLYSAVNIVFFILVVLPLLSDIIKNTDLTFNINFLKKLYDKTTINIAPLKVYISIILSIIFFMIGISVPEINKNINYFKTYPVNASNYINKVKLKGNIFNPLGWGCYLQNQTGCKVFITENMYQSTSELAYDYGQIFNVYSSYEDVLDKYNINFVIMPAKTHISLLLENNNKWKKIYQDKTSCIYKKINAPAGSEKP
ncbi:MAG: hypothetical protein AB1782_12825 [Cyanobacteriota bacterium]